MKNIYLCTVLLFSFSVFSQCLRNGNLESGTAYWNFTSRSQSFDILNCNVDTTDPLFQNGSPSNSPNQFNAALGTIVTSGNDPFLLNCTPQISIPRVVQGTKAIKLNRYDGNADVTTMSQMLAPGTNQVTFQFSLIVQNAHPETPEKQPFFTVRVLNTSNQLVNSNEFCITADASNTTLFNSALQGGSEFLYTGWQCGTIKIPEEYSNENLKLEFVIADCGRAHDFGTVYIDDVQCNRTCNEPAFGSIELNQFYSECPLDPFQVCGSYTAPQNHTLNSIQLWIMQNGNVVNVINNVTQLTSNTFCFGLYPNDFIGNSGTYELYVNAVFGNGSSSITLFDQSSVPGPDVVYGFTVPAWDIQGSNLIWDDISPEYVLEFTTEDSCCPGNCPEGGQTYTVTTVNNNLDLWTVTNALQSKCFKWRIKPAKCGEWTEWCCLASDNGYGFPPGDQFGNPFAPACEADITSIGNVLVYEQDQIVCPYEEFEVCGKFIGPCFTTLSSLKLEIIQNGVVINIISNPTLLGDGLFCFHLQPQDFGTNPAGEFDIKVIAQFTDGTTITTETYYWPDAVSFPVFSISSWSINNSILYWEDVATTYIIEFGGDYECCPPGSVTTNGQATYVINQNYFDLYTVAQSFNNKCFGWRVRAEHCGEWTEWCCLTTYTPSGDWGTPDGQTCWGTGGRPAAGLSAESITAENLSNSKGFKIYPNPVNDILKIEAVNPVKVIVLTDISGKELIRVQNPQDSKIFEINLSTLSSGIYLLNINGETVEKIVKR